LRLLSVALLVTTNAPVKMSMNAGKPTEAESTLTVLLSMVMLPLRMVPVSTVLRSMPPLKPEACALAWMSEPPLMVI
jgi:hypothetical protein